MFMLVLAIFIFGAASVCASDVNDTVIASEDTIQTELSAGNENEIVEQASNDEVISEANVGTFQELQENITQGYSSGEITLDRDYECEDEFSAEGITIAQGIIINGQGHKIDAKGKATIFNIQADWVFLKNITFLNGKSKDGGAINWEANLGSVLDCRFVNNTATDDGGAIYWHNRGILPYLNSNLVRGCSFVNNTATGNGGGAIFFAGGENEYDTTVENCNFEGNSAPTGGAIYYMGEYTATVTDCNFTNNFATKDGGAIYFDENSDGRAINCNFTNNTASLRGGAVYFNSDGTVTNCNFTDNTATGDDSYGGAIYFYRTGTVSNCTFIGNNASRGGGAVYFYGAGNVTNCNFINNKATGTESWGGAIRFSKTGAVTNCNFVDNKATGVYARGGAIYIYSGTVSNCTFIGNNASRGGGAVYFYQGTGSVTNCNFTGNNATTGSAIYFYKFDSSNTLTFSNSTFLNNRANAGALDIVKTENNITITFTGQNNLLNAIYFTDDAKVAFTNVTYWGAKGITTVSDTMSGSNKAAGQKITVGVVVNNELVLNEVNVTDENGTIVLNINAGDNYYISARHDTDSYYTEAETTISNNTKFNVNVASKTTNNKTVNITAKSNIPNDVVQGKLLFIVPNTNPINATYAGNGTWWAVYTFADYGEYEVNATFEGLENVTVNNATISISKIPTNITVNTVSLELFVGDETVIVATLTPGDAGNVTFKSSDDDIVLVEDNGNVIANGEGQAIITVSFAGNDKYAAANKTINVTVKLNNANGTVDKDKLDLKVGETYTINATKRPDTILLDITYTSSNTSVASVDKNGVVTAVGEGTAIITVSVGGDEIYALNSTNVTVRVSKVPTEITALDVSAVYNADNYLIVNLKDSTGKALTGVKVSVDLNGMKEYTTDSNGQVKVSTKGLAPNTYAVKIAFNGNAKYDKSVKEVKVTVKKATPKIIAKKKTYKAKSAKKFKITLKDNTGKPIKNAKVRLIVKKIAKKAKKSKAKTKTKKKKNILKTNKKGKATFKVKRNKKGKYIATVKYYGNKYFKAVTKKVKITIK